MLLVRNYYITSLLVVYLSILFFLPTVPPLITHPLPANAVALTTNQPLTFTISFSSRFQSNTTVTWFHNNHIISDGVTTQFTSSYQGRSTLDLGTVSRSDSGSYRVEVSNNFSNISESQRKVSSSVDLQVTSKSFPGFLELSLGSGCNIIV